MNLATIEQIMPELRDALIGRRTGKIFPLSRYSMAIDLRLSDSRYLFVSVEPADPRIYLIRRRLRDLEKASLNASAFSMQMKKSLSGAEIVAVDHPPGDRVIRIDLSGIDEIGATFSAGLVVQLTGKSANLFVIDDTCRIVHSLRQTLGEGQQIADVYSPPTRDSAAAQIRGSKTNFDGFDSLSEALDAADIERRHDAEVRSVASAARKLIERKIARLEKLQGKLMADRDSHGDAEYWKKLGDLLLANVATATRNGSTVSVIDYFDAAAPTIEIEIEENESLTGAAERFFKRYTKARNARDEIAVRLASLQKDIEAATNARAQIETEIETNDIDALRSRVRPGHAPQEKRKRDKGGAATTFARVFLSSGGFEILVGKRAKDNDQLTFKLAKSLDTWMHAADYPGSHVVIRNPNRKEIPQTTLLEAAQLAAFYSQGKAQPKAAVHYTLKKFVNKPKGAAPGLVSLSSFKTILVEPEFPENVERPE